MVNDKMIAAGKAAALFTQNHPGHSDQKVHGRKGGGKGGGGSFSKLMDWADGKGLQIGTKTASGLAGFKNGEKIIEVRDKKSQSLLGIYRDSPTQHRRIVSDFGR